MKIHITNLYNFNKEDQLVQRQHKFADAGRSLGFYEMGIFSYPVETDTESELSKRLDGVIAALEAEDVVIMQLPTRNGIRYEQLLLNKIKAYKNTKIVLLIHEKFLDVVDYEERKKYEKLYSNADSINHRIEDNSFIDDFFIKKVLLDELDDMFSKRMRHVKSVVSSDENIIHIGFGLHDKTGSYSSWVGVAIQSIIENTNTRICFHILHDKTVSALNKERFVRIVKNGGHSIHFHLIDSIFFDAVKEQLGSYTVGAMFRVMLPELLMDLSKIIYLDADVLVNRDVQEMWNIDIGDYYMAAVVDADVASGLVKPIVVKNGEVAAKEYFNSGVLYMNLDRIRKKNNMREQVSDFLLYNKQSDLPDQDALNVIYNKGIYFLDESWNYFARRVRYRGETSLRNCIYHYVGTWCLLYSGTQMDQLFYETMARTPWGTEECRKIRDASIGRVLDRGEQLEKVLSVLSKSAKKLVFYGPETNAMRNVYKLVLPKEGDYRILEEPLNSAYDILPCKSINTVLDEKDDCIIFVLPEADDGHALSNLEKMGFVNEKDFFVIPRLLSNIQGGYI